MTGATVRAATLFASIVLAACTATPPAPIVESGDRAPTTEPVATKQSTPAERDSAVPETVAPAATEHARHPATVGLLAAAREAVAAGRYDSAGAKIDQAMRIDSADPWVWHELARARFARGEFAQAVATARRSNALVGAPESLRFANLSLIAEAERLRGNTAASAQALSDAQRYESAAARAD